MNVRAGTRGRTSPPHPCPLESVFVKYRSKTYPVDKSKCQFIILYFYYKIMYILSANPLHHLTYRRGFYSPSLLTLNIHNRINPFLRNVSTHSIPKTLPL